MKSRPLCKGYNIGLNRRKLVRITEELVRICFLGRIS
jgi:hypothetical protein